MRNNLLTLPSLKPLRIAVAGEIVLDRYLWGVVARVSPEAPIPVLKLSGRDERLGNAGFVMTNLRALGAQVIALSVLGDDSNGVHLCDLMAAHGIETSRILRDSSRPTVVKERFLGSVQAASRAMQHLLRVDQEETYPISPQLEAALIASARLELERVDGILISDINKGILTCGVLSALIDDARARRVPVIIDPRLDADFSMYRGAIAITPNRHETETVTEMRLVDREAWEKAANLLIDNLGLHACLMTLDREGMFLKKRGSKGIHLPTVPVEVNDVTGAGDVVLSTFGFFVIAGMDFTEAAQLANLAAGIEVSRLGAEVISREDLASVIANERRNTTAKILAPAEIAAALTSERLAGKKIAFTYGFFGVVRREDIRMLDYARKHADVLVVGVEAACSGKSHQEHGSGCLNIVERAEILAAMESVNYVVMMLDRDIQELLRTIRPDALMLSVREEGLINANEIAFVRSYGGQVLSPSPMMLETN
jgi:D-beta-D-heptose 7-phosphate kinase/D-beta-D-heptose 1-phosphate adenosyltransferase